MAVNDIVILALSIDDQPETITWPTGFTTNVLYNTALTGPDGP